MPTVSPKQKRLMLAVDHGWHPKGAKLPSRAVAHEFVQADKAAGRVTPDAMERHPQRRPRFMR